MAYDSVTLTNILIDGTYINITIGPETLQIARSDIANYQAGGNAETLVTQNMGICMSLCGAEFDITNNASIVSHLQTQFCFKCWDGISAFADTNLTDVSVDVNDLIHFSIGAESFTLAKSDLQQYMNGVGTMDALTGNMAIWMKGRGINMLDPIAIRNCLSSTTFRYWQS